MDENEEVPTPIEEPTEEAEESTEELSELIPTQEDIDPYFELERDW